MGDPLLSESDLAGIDETVLSVLDQNGTVYRQSRTSDSMGGSTLAFVQVTTCPMRIIKGDLILEQTPDRRGRGMKTRAVMPRGTDVQLGDRLDLGNFQWTVLAVPVDARSTLVCQVALTSRKRGAVGVPAAAAAASAPVPGV